MEKDSDILGRKFKDFGIQIVFLAMLLEFRREGKERLCNMKVILI